MTGLIKKFGRKLRKKPERPEDLFHESVAQFLDNALPADAFWTTIPAGGGGLQHGIRQKKKGYKAGMTDILICYRGIAHFLELKSEDGGLSKVQKFIRTVILRAGGKWATAKTLEQVEAALAEWGIPCAAHTIVQAARKVA